MRVKCLIFDMDGLMFDSERIAGEAYKLAAKEYGYEIKDGDRYQLLGRSKTDGYRVIKEIFGENYPAVEVSKLAATYKDNYIKEYGLPVKKGLFELLEYVKQKEIFIAVASSSDREVIRWYLELKGVEKYFDYIIAGDQVEKSKPNPEIFLKVCSHFNVTPEETLVLEDSKMGIMAAVNGRIPVICIPDILEHDEEITKLTYKTLPDLSAVIKVLSDN